MGILEMRNALRTCAVVVMKRRWSYDPFEPYQAADLDPRESDTKSIRGIEKSLLDLSTDYSGRVPWLAGPEFTESAMAMDR
jgi:hypothetical protein